MITPVVILSESSRGQGIGVILSVTVELSVDSHTDARLIFVQSHAVLVLHVGFHGPLAKLHLGLAEVAVKILAFNLRLAVLEEKNNGLNIRAKYGAFCPIKIQEQTFLF